ncbi:hypothetical protein LZK73_06245 [Neorhizobium galegae]|nr:hypothetical protein LZK73_06245 [Neorhizobium galegae]
MSETQKPISIEDAISPAPTEAADDLHAWQVKKLAERKSRLMPDDLLLRRQ